MFRIIPREEKYFELLNEMADQINLAAETLLTLFGDIANAEQHAEKVRSIEHQCDELTHEVLKRLSKSFITPIDREDIHALVNALDTVVDMIEGAAARVIMYAVDESTPAMQELARILADTAAATGRAVARLPTNEAMSESIIEVHNLESRGDAVYRAAVRELFAETRDAIALIKYKEVYEKLEQAIDACEDATNVLEGVALKNA